MDLSALRTLREAKGLTQDELAAKVGVTKGYISLLESGDRRKPSMPVLMLLASTLSVPLDRLLGKTKKRNPGIQVVWSRIIAHQGEPFHQIHGGEFRFQVHGGYLQPDRTNRRIPKSDIAKALALVPLHNTVPLQLLQGPSFIFAILMDPRIRQNNW